MTPEEQLKKITEVFGTRAEYLKDQLFDLFTKPTYWPELLTTRPCVLEGGRGTGKTTALRGLSYVGMQRTQEPGTWPFVGMYWRIDTSVANSFRGAVLGESSWRRLFEHYINLVMVQLIAEFAVWATDSLPDALDDALDPANADLLAKSLFINVPASFSLLRRELDHAIIAVESYINNIGSVAAPLQSIASKPVAIAARELFRGTPFAGMTFCFLIDEFENLLPYQQRVFNTLIKHAGDDNLSYKIGVKETSYRDRATVNENEVLSYPADIALIEITERLKESDFSQFAREVCNERLERLEIESADRCDVAVLLPELSIPQEAELLGARQRAEALLSNIAHDDPQLAVEIGRYPPNEIAFIDYWSQSQRENPADLARHFVENPSQWRTRRGNYEYAMLFTLRRGKRGLSKYYAGWDTYVQLADGNIRLLLQLVTEALRAHLLAGHPLSEAVTPANQTRAAQQIGETVLSELQYVTTRGADLTRLVLALGRVFGVMAAEPEGHTPEVNQFRVDDATDDVRNLLDNAVMHLALTRFQGNKMAGFSGETKDFDYQLHPIYCAYFAYSHRRKRRMTLTSAEVEGLVSSPKRMIVEVLRKQGRSELFELPDQLQLFQDFYQ